MSLPKSNIAAFEIQEKPKATDGSLETALKAHVHKIFIANDRNAEITAKTLQVTLKTLYKYLRLYGINTAVPKRGKGFRPL